MGLICSPNISERGVWGGLIESAWPRGWEPPDPVGPGVDQGLWVARKRKPSRAPGTPRASPCCPSAA